MEVSHGPPDLVGRIHDEGAVHDNGFVIGSPPRTNSVASLLASSMISPRLPARLRWEKHTIRPKLAVEGHIGHQPEGHYSSIERADGFTRNPFRWYNPSASAWVTIVMSSFNLANGMTTVIPDGGFRIDQFLLDVGRFGVTSVILVPTMIQWIINELRSKSYDLSSWRFLIYGSAPSSPALIRQMREVLPCDLVQTYGLTEITGGWATYLTEKDHQEALSRRPEWLKSVGRFGPHFECSIRDTDGKPLPPNTQGEVWIRGTAVMKGYLNRPEETAEVMREGGWLCTNDIAQMDDDGFLYLLDRKKFMIISGAVNVFPATVEAVLSEHVGIEEAAVVGAPHPEWGEAVVAFVRIRNSHAGLTACDILDFCTDKLSKPEIPKHVVFLVELPKTSNGKIMKQPLREMLARDPSLLPWTTE